jgi:hypothetical protein
MPTKFSFEGALLNAFRAAHAKTFLWKFAVAYALVFTAFLLLLGLLAKDSFIAFTQAIEALEEADFDQTDPGAMMAVLFGTLTPLIPWAALGSIGSGVLWAMFESASQRRYVRNEPFSLRLGADELRMMVVACSGPLCISP